MKASYILKYVVFRIHSEGDGRGRKSDEHGQLFAPLPQTVEDRLGQQRQCPSLEGQSRGSFHKAILATIDLSYLWLILQLPVLIFQAFMIQL